MSTFVTRIRSIYDRHAPRQIHPYIGETFVNAKKGDLRIMAVGINTYVGPHDEGKESPSWFGGWFAEQTHRYQKGVWRELKALGEAITKPPYRLASKSFRGMASVFLTNAVKIYMPAARGKQAHQLSADDYERHLDQWHDELDLMAEENLLPHVIAIIGEPFWGRACDSFRQAATFKSLRVRSYRSCSGACHTFLNAITLPGPKTEHDLLLVRLRHPAARTRKGSAEWLLSQPEFQAMAS